MMGTGCVTLLERDTLVSVPRVASIAVFRWTILTIVKRCSEYSMSWVRRGWKDEASCSSALSKYAVIYTCFSFYEYRSSRQLRPTMWSPLVVPRRKSEKTSRRMAAVGRWYGAVLLLRPGHMVDSGVGRRSGNSGNSSCALQMITDPLAMACLAGVQGCVSPHTRDFTQGCAEIIIMQDTNN